MMTLENRSVPHFCFLPIEKILENCVHNIGLFLLFSFRSPLSEKVICAPFFHFSGGCSKNSSCLASWLQKPHVTPGRPTNGNK